MSTTREDLQTEDVFGLGCALEYFSEHAEVQAMLNNLENVVNSTQTNSEKAYERFVDILKQYHEQPHLLDKYLEAILNTIIEIVRNPTNDIKLKHEAFKYMYFVINVRGYKTVVRHLPHEVSDLEPVLKLLESQDCNDQDTWTTRYVLLLWLSIIVMIPFHMSRLDGFETPDEKSKTVMSRILDVCKLYTVVPDKCRDAAAYLISKFLTRVDVKERYLNEFLNWACDLSVSKENNFVRYGTLASVAMIIKHSKREDIVPYAQRLLQWIINAEIKNHPGSNIQRLVHKILQRIGLVLLPPRVATWRYKRGNRTLAANLSAGDVGACKVINENHNDDDDEEIDVPEEIEEVIDQLIQGLKNCDSVVRWSAAKGIGRVTGRLPKDLADDVVASVLELFSQREGDGAWHGGCLALAELGRRGLLLPTRLPDVVPLVLKALIYDEPKGYASVGSHIRDAACYVCWSFARAYDAPDLLPFVNDIASQLLIVTCFDREINCRRAASAAFQENVGRQGTFPHGIDILTTADFLAVSVRNTSFLHISYFIAQHEEYTEKLINHLVERKVIHWDINIRDLTSKTLHILTPLTPRYMSTTVLPDLFEKTRSIDLNCRHGAILAIAEIIHALYKMNEVINDPTIEAVENLIPKYRERLYFRGMGGELMKQACCTLIQKSSLSKLPFHKQTILDEWMNLINECLAYDVPNIRQVAIEVVPAFLHEYYCGVDHHTVQHQLVKKYIQGLRGDNQVLRMGHASVLGVMPEFILEHSADAIINALLESMAISEATLKWAESRRDTIKALTNICVTLEYQIGKALKAEHIMKIYECFLIGLTEYTQDHRGDIGAWVRESSMIGLQKIILIVNEQRTDILTKELICQALIGIAQQAVEKIDRTRALAGRIFYGLLHSEPRVHGIPNHDELLEIFPKPDCDILNWNSEAITFPKFVNLIKYPDYTYNLMLGLVCSIGGMTESLVKSSSQSLFDYLKDELKIRGEEEIVRLCNVIYKIFTDHQKNDRIVVPMFRFLVKLFSSGCITVVLNDDQSDFAKKTLKSIQIELNGCKDIYKLIDGINILAQFIQIKSEVCATALTQLSILLCHRQPYIRRSTSIKLFESLLMYGDDSIIPPENLDKISELLSTTNWEDAMDDIKPIRNELCLLMGTRIPIVKRKT